MELALPVAWNRSRATALGITLLLHLVAVIWLLTLRFDLPTSLAEDTDLIWLPLPPELAPPSPLEPGELPSTAVQPPGPTPLPEVEPDIFLSPSAEDWERTARAVAGAIGRPSAYRQFGETPKAPMGRPKEELPPSIWPKPLPRVGTTVTTPEGETIIWVSDNCYVPISSRSLTMEELHKARQGVRICQIGAGRKKVRDDLFDAIKRPPPPQEPGCGPDGVGLSCGR